MGATFTTLTTLQKLQTLTLPVSGGIYKGISQTCRLLVDRLIVTLKYLTRARMPSHLDIVDVVIFAQVQQPFVARARYSTRFSNS